MKNDNQKIGKLAEKYFSIWCTEADYVINQSTEDETGWDFIVEDSLLKQTEHETLHEPEYTYYFQVKSTKGRARKVDVYLENLYRLSKAPAPCFFIFLVFDSKFQPQKLYIKHLDEEITSKILKRVSKAIENNEVNKLHKKTMQIKFEDTDCLNLFDGINIRSFVEKIVGESYLEYKNNKQKLLENTGYEDGFGNFNLGFESEEDIIEFTHLYLGIKKSIQIKKGRLLQERFGYIFKTTSADNAKLEISPPKPNQIGLLHIFRDDLPTQIFFSVNHYISDLNPLLEEKYRLNRIESIYFDILYNPSSDKAKIVPNFNNHTRLNLIEFIKYANFYNWMQNPPGIQVKLYVDGKSIFTLCSPDGTKEPVDLIDIKILESIIRLSTFFPSIVEDMPSLFQIDALRDKIEAMDKIISLRPFEVQVNFQDNTLIDGLEYNIICQLTLVIGNNSIILISVLTGKSCNIKDGRYKFLIEKTNIIKAISTTEPITLINQSIQNLKEKIAEDYKDTLLIYFNF